MPPIISRHTPRYISTSIILQSLLDNAYVLIKNDKLQKTKPYSILFV